MEKKLSALRMLLTKHKLAAFLQPVHDEYLSEYPPACNKRVEWLTGFSGSAGTAVVLPKKAALFTDGRYTLQAKDEVNGKLFAPYNSGETPPEAWLAGQFPLPIRGRAGVGAQHKKKHKLSKNAPLPTSPLMGEELICVGYDPKLYTKAMLARMSKTLDKKNIRLAPVENLVDVVWHDRPPAPSSPMFIHDITYAGETSQSKRRRMAKHIKAMGADACVIAAPDAVCWLLNIRGHDVPCTPLVLGAAILYADGRVDAFIAPERCDAQVKKHLGSAVALCPPAKLEAGLKKLKKKRVLCDPQSLPVWFMQILSNAGAVIIEGEDPCLLAKAVKNPVELQGMRDAHIRDGVAVTKLLCWLDGAHRPLTETDVCVKLAAFRGAHPMFSEPSFPTIAGSGPHGAIVHYRVSPHSNRALKQGELFLLDSGGQYPDGTTDITRTVPIGIPTPEQKDRFTRVLKGHIAIATSRFPQGTTGSQLDALARQYLWQAGLDYDHGTGHGVGSFLGVHEGPQRISKRGGDAALKAGMIVSNEPGYYKAGEYGIRIENLVAVVAAQQMSGVRRQVSKDSSTSDIRHPASGAFAPLSFETITCVPIDTRLVDTSMLTEIEKQWLNDYHGWVLASLDGRLEEHEREWLKERCRPV